jgi:hypothetical protein
MNTYTRNRHGSRRPSKGLASSIKILLRGLSVQLFIPFFRYGFGERFVNLRRSKWFAILFIGVPILIYWAVFRIDNALINNTSDTAEVQTQEEEQDVAEYLGLKSLEGNDLQSGIDGSKHKDDEGDHVSPAEKKLNKKKTSFLLHYISWYVFFIIYMIVMLGHHRQFKIRCARFNYDYSRDSYFGGYSWQLIQIISLYLHRWILTAKYYINYCFIYVEKILRYYLLRSRENQYPLFRPSMLDVDSYMHQSFLSPAAVLTCYVEPAIIIGFGLVQILFSQWFGLVCLFLGFTRMFWAHYDVRADRNAVLNKIDELISIIDKKESRAEKMEMMELSGFSFNMPLPTEDEIAENLQSHFGAKKERFVVT